MPYFLVNVLLALLWATLQQFRLIDFILGMALGYGMLVVAREWFGAGAKRYIRRVPQVFGFILYYLGEVLIATWVVTKAIFRTQSSLRPGIIAVPLDGENSYEIVLLNYLLIFTPGTLGIDISEDRSTLYVHIYDAPDADAARQHIKTGLERRLLEVMR